MDSFMGLITRQQQEARASGNVFESTKQPFLVRREDMPRVIASRRDRRVDALSWCHLPRCVGESSQGPRLRLDALERCRRSVERASDMVVSSLSRRELSHLAEWLLEASRSDDPEAPLRLAVVRSGFCELSRSSITRRLQRILREYPLVHFVPQHLKPTGFQIAFRSLEFVRNDNEHIVFIVDQVETVETRALDDLLTALIESSKRCSLVLIAGSAWTPHFFGGVARLFAREFSLPNFELFADAFFERLFVRGDLGVTPGSIIVKQWLEAATIAETRSVDTLTQRALYFLFVHFAQPGTFLAATDLEALEIVAQEPDVRKALLDADTYRHTKTSITNEVKLKLLADTERLLYWQQLSRALAAMADATVRRKARGRAALDTWSLLASALFDPESIDQRQENYSQRQLRRQMKSALSSLDALDLAALLISWRDNVAQALEPRLSDTTHTQNDALHPPARRATTCSRLLLAKLVELSHIASLLSPEDEIKVQQLRYAALDLFKLAQQALNQFATQLPATAFNLIRCNDHGKAAQPFAGTALNATVDALASSSKDLRCLAFQVAADHLNVDLNSWYHGFQERLLYADRRFVPRSITHTEDNHLRSVQFVAAIRDLLYTGLVKEPSHKRGRFLVCGT